MEKVQVCNLKLQNKLNSDTSMFILIWIRHNGPHEMSSDKNVIKFNAEKSSLNERLIWKCH